VSRGPPVIVLEDTAEPLAAADVPTADRPGASRRRPTKRRGEPERRVRPLAVVVIGILAQQVVEVPGSEDDEVVEAFDLDALDQPLDVGVEVGRPVRQPNGCDPSPGQRRAKGAPPPRPRTCRRSRGGGAWAWPCPWARPWRSIAWSRRARPHRGWWWVETCARRVPGWMKTRLNANLQPLAVSTRVIRKSQAHSVWACDLMNSSQVR